MWHSFYINEPKVLLKHCQTRWLSLLRCTRRYLDLFDGLLSYFRSCDDQTAKVVSITERLENPLTKPIIQESSTRFQDSIMKRASECASLLAASEMQFTGQPNCLCRLRFWRSSHTNDLDSCARTPCGHV